MLVILVLRHVIFTIFRLLPIRFVILQDLMGWLHRRNTDGLFQYPLIAYQVKRLCF